MKKTIKTIAILMGTLMMFVSCNTPTDATLEDIYNEYTKTTETKDETSANEENSESESSTEETVEEKKSDEDSSTETTVTPTENDEVVNEDETTTNEENSESESSTEETTTSAETTNEEISNAETTSTETTEVKTENKGVLEYHFENTPSPSDVNYDIYLNYDTIVKITIDDLGEMKIEYKINETETNTCCLRIDLNNSDSNKIIVTKGRGGVQVYVDNIEYIESTNTLKINIHVNK